ncbi:hypothetical protein [uncultured Sphaerochaeta sp.]|uniref:ComF family protein n=1 Tax=uncultured Sphaerochaeta sp. TaxID=886478 RepID=UPI0029CA7CB2|nr:hypothetical protein [uncultured Sphaerochaeta sp.]
MWCHLCKKLSDTTLCPTCEEAIRKTGYESLFTHRCPVCGQPVLDATYACPFCNEGILSYGPYGKTLASLIKCFKFGGDRSLTPLLSGLYLPLIKRVTSPIIIPIPCSIEGYRRRGFDQSMVIASYLARMEGFAYLSLFNRHKGMQHKFLSKEQRLGEQAIQLTHSKKKHHHFVHFLSAGYTAVLLDDVKATGATSRRARELLESHFGCKATIIVLADV